MKWRRKECKGAREIYISIYCIYYIVCVVKVSEREGKGREGKVCWKQEERREGEGEKRRGEVDGGEWRAGDQIESCEAGI